jgi:hypothetical protein
VQETGAIAAYVAAQEKCARQAPDVAMGFERLVLSGSVVFRDVTPFFATANILGDNPGKAMLIRPRRWGKSVLGTAWIEFLRGREDLFKGTWAHDKMRSDKLIGVHWDLSDGCLAMTHCLIGLASSINRGLALAERVEGYGAAAVGRRVRISAEIEKRFPDWTQGSVAHCVGILQSLFLELDEISAQAGRRVALFVDEYDFPCVQALGDKKRFEQLNQFFTALFTTLKARSSVIPFLFVTGSSRLAMKGFFSGPNDITDLSYDGKAATALGYTWAEIESLYREQLPLLEKLHGLTRDELKAEMERWYNFYRWSKNGDVKVFNPLSVNMFVKTGEFAAHWQKTADSTLQQEFVRQRRDAASACQRRANRVGDARLGWK